MGAACSSRPLIRASEDEQWGRKQSVEGARKFVLKNSRGMTVAISNVGCAFLEVRVPAIGENDHLEDVDVVCSYDDADSLVKRKPNFSTIVGRCANRIANATFDLDGKTYNLAKNDGENHIHGGPQGYCRKIFDLVQLKAIKATKTSVPTPARPRGSPAQSRDVAFLHLQYVSPDGDEGYPGELQVDAKFYLNDYNDLIMDLTASAHGQPTIANLTHHAYWNLDGHDFGSVFPTHKLQIHPLTDSLMYTKPVTAKGRIVEPPTKTDPQLDFSMMRKMVTSEGSNVKLDHNFVLSYSHPESLPEALMAPKATLQSMRSRVRMKVFTNQVGLQVYTGNSMDKKAVEKWKGKGNTCYDQHGAICLEPQAWPDAVNMETKGNFPSVRVDPKHPPGYGKEDSRRGEEAEGKGVGYRHVTAFRFDILPKEARRSCDSGGGGGRRSCE